MAEKPTCSVLICTHDRAALLRLVLESLCAQSVDRGLFETVVVDDGSSDGTAAVVERFASRLPIRYEYQRNAGLASARNHALFLARGEVVILQDDDDIAGPHLVAEHLRTHRAFPQDHFAVLGYTNLTPALTVDPVMHFVTEVGQFLFSYPSLRGGELLDFSYFWGGRSSCKRRFLLEHGVFNPVFRFGCEDIELAYRLGRSGFQVVYNPRAASTTVRAFSFDQFCDRLERQGRSNWVFSRLHDDPQVQRWTEVESAAREWEATARMYQTVRSAGRKLDRAYRAKLAAGLPIGHDREFLHEMYWAAFRASKVKGIVEQSRESAGLQPVYAEILEATPFVPTGGPNVAVASEHEAGRARGPVPPPGRAAARQ